MFSLNSYHAFASSIAFPFLQGLLARVLSLWLIDLLEHHKIDPMFPVYAFDSSINMSRRSSCGMEIVSRYRMKTCNEKKRNINMNCAADTNFAN